MTRYSNIVAKVEKTLDGLVEHSENKRELMKQHSSKAADMFVIPELYLMKGLRESVMLIVNPYDRIQKWYEYFRKD